MPDTMTDTTLAVADRPAADRPAIRFVPLSADFAARVRAGGPDDNGQPAERAVSGGTGVPCRQCLRQVPAGAAYLICGHRPFVGRHAYAETGPIFLCAEACPEPLRAAAPGAEMPAILSSATCTLRGYGADERILYGTGGVVARDGIAARAAELLARPDVAFVHVRSVANTCFLVRIDRA
ncbi:MAG: DUF1203 domain-containing protein [Rhodobacteraceae bacterium]|jgi:hypothetical protein|nr:DUF1203 domain-containing protein [Paracoccaceae bacterium]